MDLSVAVALALALMDLSSLHREKQNISAQISEKVLRGYFGAKRTVLGFFSIALANSFTGPYIIQPA